MKVKDLFQVGDPIQSIDGTVEFLDHNNCQIENKTKQENAIVFDLKRGSDGQQGRAYLRIRKEFEAIADQLLVWAFGEARIVGLSLNQLRELETNLSVTSVGGRMMLSPK